MSVEELSEVLEDSVLDVSQSLNPERKEHPRFSKLYKNAFRKGEEQRKRRESHLQNQKNARHDFQALARSLLDPSDDEETPMVTETSKWKGRARHSSNPFSGSRNSSERSRRRIYKDQLMLSEWLLDIPMDFNDKWLAVPCPVGKRNLVVAGKGKTQFFSRNGSYLGSFPSNLPQGKRAHNGHYGKPNLTLLDTVYHEETKVFYVLDIIIWDGMPFNECDTELRSFWVKNKMKEVEADNKSKLNPYPFITLPYIPCSQLQTLFHEPLSVHFRQEEVSLDGILFYHSDAFYLPGPTPLVGWLKGYMVPELIPELEVHSDYLENKPDGYASMKSYIDDYQNSAKKDKKNKKIFTFHKEMPPPTPLSEKEEKVRSFFAQKEVISMEKAMEFWTLG